MLVQHVFLWTESRGQWIADPEDPGPSWCPALEGRAPSLCPRLLSVLAETPRSARWRGSLAAQGRTEAYGGLGTHFVADELALTVTLQTD